MAGKQSDPNVRILNRRASHDYQVVEKYTAGIQLSGTEIKSIRAGDANISDAHCVFEGDELFIRNLHISPFERGSYNNHEPKRSRKLLMTKNELRKLRGKASEKGFAIVPIMIFFSERGFAKLEIGLGKGKKSFDKREDIKEKDAKREIDRNLKS